MLYFISDTHFSDPNVIMTSRTQFKLEDEMNDLIIKNWNSVIKDDDIVYHLGDVGDYKFLKELKGDIRLVLGNHDVYENIRKEYPDMKIYDKPILDKYYFLSHAPIGFIPSDCPFLNIHGHLHNYNYSLGYAKTWYEGNRYFNVSCEQINYTPISEVEIMRKLGYKNFDL